MRTAPSEKKTTVPGLNSAHQNLPYIRVLTVQCKRQEVVGSGRQPLERLQAWCAQRIERVVRRAANIKLDSQHDIMVTLTGFGTF